MSRIKAIIFDFDGVILESVDVKTWAFGKLFESYPQQTSTIMDYHKANGGVSRFVKIRYIYKNILKQPLSETKFHQLCQGYSHLVVERVIQSNFVKGALEFLKKYHNECQFFVISGTPQDEMRAIIKVRGLEKYFIGVYGSPKDKIYWTRRILKENKLFAYEVLWVGDAASDYEAAVDSSIRFVARLYKKEKDIFQGKQVDYQIYNLVDFDKIFRSLIKKTSANDN